MFFSGQDKIVCTFEEDTCLFDDELALKERFMIIKSTVSKWENTLNVGMYSSLFVCDKTCYYVLCRPTNQIYVRQKKVFRSLCVSFFGTLLELIGMHHW